MGEGRIVTSPDQQTVVQLGKMAQLVLVQLVMVVVTPVYARYCVTCFIYVSSFHHPNFIYVEAETLSRTTIAS